MFDLCFLEVCLGISEVTLVKHDLAHHLQRMRYPMIIPYNSKVSQCLLETVGCFLVVFFYMEYISEPLMTLPNAEFVVLCFKDGQSFVEIGACVFEIGRESEGFTQ